MNYSEALLLWKPSTNTEQKSEKVLVTPLEPFDRSRAAERAYFGDKGARSGGAAYRSIRNGTREENMKRVMVDFNTLVVRENMDVQAVHAAFCEIQEYRDQLAPDAPVPEKWQRTFRREVMEEPADDDDTPLYQAFSVMNRNITAKQRSAFNDFRNQLYLDADYLRDRCRMMPEHVTRRGDRLMALICKIPGLWK